MERPETKYAKSHDGTHLAYQVFGEGSIDFLWVQGFVSNNDFAWSSTTLWVSFMERVASWARVILFDRRGVGQSDRSTELPTLDEQIDDLRAVLDAAGSKRAALVGYSEGGPMSVLFAATQPERVSHLILYGTYPRMLMADDYEFGLTPEEFKQLESLVDNWGTGAMVDAFAPSHASNPAVRAYFARFEREACSPGGVGAIMKILPNIDVRPLLPTVRVPTLVITREHDHIAKVDASR